MKPVLSVENLTVSYPSKQGRLHAVDGASFELFAGEVLGLVGRSGCGKSTLARAVCRLVEPDAGRILLRGQDVTHVSGADRRAYYRSVQMVFQNPAGSFDPRRTLGDGVGESLRNAGVDLEERRKRVAELLIRCGLEPSLAQRYPSQVSGGQCQRAALARALAPRPSVLICDEATSSLDVTVARRIVKLIGSLRDESGLAVLFISHDLALVQAVCSRMLVMSSGRIVESGRPDDVVQHPQSLEALRLIEAAEAAL